MTCHSLNIMDTAPGLFLQPPAEGPPNPALLDGQQKSIFHWRRVVHDVKETHSFRWFEIVLDGFRGFKFVFLIVNNVVVGNSKKKQ
jgi:hypothetical protein